jgi:hypothetical protein
MSIGTRRSSLMKKKPRGNKSRDTVPLSIFNREVDILIPLPLPPAVSRRGLLCQLGPPKLVNIFDQTLYEIVKPFCGIELNDNYLLDPDIN